ncbi:MAG: SpaA isopeptide-forming pilin-related protein, partial [Proteiniphilum sp.]|nr:SpaA isopeptide-forming pilin-related protein [Proteiniphilum sp.]
MSDHCVLMMGRESHFPYPYSTSCGGGLCTFVYQEPQRTIDKEIQIKKISTDEVLIEGAVFRLDETTDYTTQSDGLTPPITITNGQSYVVQETSVPAGFILDDREIYITMNNTGTIEVSSEVDFDYDPVTGILSITNRRDCENISFMVYKKDADNGNPLEGALIEKYKDNDRNHSLSTSLTDESGRTHLMTMQCGDIYYIKETAVVPGYKSDRPAFAVVKTNPDGSIEILDSAQLESWVKIANIWVLTFVNHQKRDTPVPILDPPAEGCDPTYAYDNTISTRNGFRQSSKEKLSKIVVFYKDSCVRSYTFCYGVDFYWRAKLEKISQWSSEDTLEAYTHSFEYYNDAGSHQSLFQEPDVWNITDNDPDIDQSKRMSNKLRNFFKTGFVSPSVLGGSRTWSTGINGGADLGLFPVFPLKTLSAGIYLNGSISSSKGKTTLLDINGDGLPDRVYNVMEGVKNKTYYRLQKSDGSGFEAERKELKGISIFLEDFSDNASIGLQASAVVHGGIQKGFIGNSWTSVYFSDMNGDGFVDLVSPDGVKNIGIHQQPPKFNFPDCLAPEITTTLDTIDVRCDTNFSFTPEIYERDRTKELRYDLVRVWQADMDCSLLPDLTYSICAPVHLAYDSIALENFCGFPDSVIVSIEYYGQGLTGTLEHILLWSDVIGDSDTSEHGPDYCNLNVTPGEDLHLEPDESPCDIMLRKVDQNGNPLGNVVFKLQDGRELVTDADNDGLTDAFHIDGCMDVTEIITLPHCSALQQTFTICRGSENGEDCEITVQGQGSVSKEWIDGRYVYVITIINDCYEQAMCFARILKVDQYGNPLEGVEFEIDNQIGGLTLSTNEQGLTSLFNIFQGGCSQINEIRTLLDCDPLEVPISICADGNCNLQISPNTLPFTSEWVNGILIHTITIVNQCNEVPLYKSLNLNIEGDESSTTTAYTNPTYDLSALKLCKGDKLFFRVRPQDNGVKKKVVWDPAVLPFSQSLSRTAYLDENHRIFGGGNKASESQLLQGDSLFFCPAQGNITIESVIRPLASVLTDDICFEIWYENDRIYQYTIAAGQNTSLQTYTTSFSVDTMDKLRFKVVCRSNVNMHELQWYPRVYYNYLNYGNETIDAVILDEENNSVRMLEYVIAPWHDFYHHTTNLSNNCLNKVYDTPPTLQPVTRSLSKLYILSGTSGSAYITIKQDGALLFAQEMSFSAGYT